MGIGASLIIKIIVGIAVVAAITITVLNLPKIKEIIKKRKEKKKLQKVAFGSTKQILKDQAKEILQNAPNKMKMEDIERICEETPFFVVDVDDDMEEISDFTSIKPEKTESEIDDFMRKNKGIVVFD